jgi:hypothetical protein
VAIPVPFLLMWAPSLGLDPVRQRAAGDQPGPHLVDDGDHEDRPRRRRNRGLAMGLNEFAGYFAVAGSALATGWIAARFGLRPEPFYLGVGFVALGLGLSLFAARETRAHAAQEALQVGAARRR